MQIGNSQSPSINGPLADPQNAQRDPIASSPHPGSCGRVTRQQGQSAPAPTQPLLAALIVGPTEATTSSV
jgi:hypothetical protein